MGQARPYSMYFPLSFLVSFPLSTFYEEIRGEGDRGIPL